MLPPFEITTQAIQSIAAIERLLGQYEGIQAVRPAPMLRRSMRVRTVQGSVAIEGNTLNQEQVTAILDGRRVMATNREILEVKNALAAYDEIDNWKPASIRSLQSAHKTMMKGLIETAGKWRGGDVGIIRGSKVTHVAPPADRVAYLVKQLLDFLKTNDTHPLVTASVVHYELEFIHPFDDGNGRIGRLWHSAILNQYNSVFQFVPVESVIRDDQQRYYDVLRQCDKAGSSSQFVEFSLESTHTAMTDFIRELAPVTITAEMRLESASAEFHQDWFSRRDYMRLFPNISSATASRDLRKAVECCLLEKTGKQATTTYRFSESDKRS